VPIRKPDPPLGFHLWQHGIDKRMQPRPRRGDVVWIFDSGADLDPVSVEIQRHYCDEWRQSFRSAGEHVVGAERGERVSQLD